MVNKSGDQVSDVNLGSDAWNVADGYTKIKILRQLIMLDRWDTIAQFGTEEIGEDMNYNDDTINKRRVEALQRFYSTIKQLLGNVYFAIRSADKQKVKALVGRIDTVSEFMPKTYSTREDSVSHNIYFEIHEELFDKILDILQEVKDQLNTPLNNAGLIFRPSEEVDLDKIMAEIVEGG